jgi:hypothetical protein
MKNKNLFILTVFLGAFLLFQIQPIMGKYLLPWFGGVPAVWTVCLLFFQFLLLGGYVYAHFLQRFKPRRQVIIHVLLLACAALISMVLFFKWGSPILPAQSLKPVDEVNPTWNIFYLLLVSIGLAYFLLSTSTSLLQAWFHRIKPTESPYFFYGISNAAALLALISYPFIVEPLLTIQMHALLWSGGFLVYTGICLRCALGVRRMSLKGNPNRSGKAVLSENAPGTKDYLLWTVLAACGVLALMSVTNQMTQDMPPVPFLWILALALYLLSYVVGFVDRPRQDQGLYIFSLALSGFIAWVFVGKQLGYQLLIQIAGYSFILFSICLFCHNALYRIKPHPRYLTGFYLCLSLGGALGGLFVAIIAPLIFNRYWEYQLTLIMAASLAAIIVYRDRKGVFYKARHAGWPLVILLAVFISFKPAKDTMESLHESRNFFGTLRVIRDFDKGISPYSLFHGRIRHGGQYQHPKLAMRPTTYYTAESGIGQAIQTHPKRRGNEPMRVGVVGLGVGTLATYGRENDLYRWYEINPTVIDLACFSPYFSYIRDSAATIEIIPGDARIKLEHELRLSGSQQFDILVIDAFSGDSVPVHLLTREAFLLYLNHLNSDGLLAVHISSNHLNLVPLMQAMRDECGLHGVLIDHNANDRFSLHSSWVVFGREKGSIPGMRWENAAFREKNKSIRIWTDDFSNLLSLF